jgi:hypothetical protein
MNATKPINPFQPRFARPMYMYRILNTCASSHKAAIVQKYLKQEKVVELPHPPYSPDLAPCDIFLFPRLKNTLLKENIKHEKISVRL